MLDPFAERQSHCSLQWKNSGGVEVAIDRRTAIRGLATFAAVGSTPGLASALGQSASGNSQPESAVRNLAGLPSREQMWKWLLFLSSLGPKHTGNAAHKKFINFLAEQMAALRGFSVTRDTYRFTRWEAQSWSLTARETGGEWKDVPVASYYPYSGETSDRGVTALLAYVGVNPPRDIFAPKPDDRANPFGELKGKIAVLDCPVHGMRYADTYDVWGTYRDDFRIRDVSKDSIWMARSAPSLTALKQAGAAGVILCWTDFSDENVAGHVVPQQSPLHGLPCLWVGRRAGGKLRELAEKGGEATIVLQADVTPDSDSDTVIATIPGTTDETLVLVTHTDGPNAVQENGGLGLLGLANYIASLPKGSLRRTHVFAFVTGHFSAVVPGSAGFIKQHPEIISKTVAAVAVEHLGAREWADDENGRFVPTGNNEVSTVIVKEKSLANLVLQTVQGTLDDRLAVLNPVHGRSSGEGGRFLAAGIPTLNYIPTPTFLLKASTSGCIEKLDSRLFHTQVSDLALMLRRLDAMSAGEIAG